MSEALNKSIPVKSLAKIMIPVPKINPLWSACLHCTNVNNILEIWHEKLEFEEPINLQQGMYFLVAFMYS